MSNLLQQIDRVEEIRTLFTTEYVSFVKAAYKPALQTPRRTIHKNIVYMNWRAEVEMELDALTPSACIDDIRRLFRKIDNGFSEEVEFDRLEAKLLVLKKNLLIQKSEIIQEDEAKFQELELTQNILHALVNIQKTNLFHGRSEDDINDGVRNALDMLYEVKDQTRQGKSETGKRSGELDILLCKKSMPWAIVEALRLSFLDKDSLSKHINKALTNYDPIGCKNSYVIIYAMAPDFNILWRNIVAYLNDYVFPFDIIRGIEEVAGDYAEAKRGFVCLNRNGTLVKLHILSVNMS